MSVNLSCKEMWNKRYVDLLESINRCQQKLRIQEGCVNEKDFLAELQILQYYLAKARLEGDRYFEAQTLGNIGAVYHGLHQFTQAIEFYDQGLKLFKALGEQRQEVWILNNIGSVYSRLNQPDKAIEAYQRAIVTCRLQGNLVREGWVLKNLSHIYRSITKFDQAIAALQQAIKIFREVKDMEEEAEVLKLIQEIRQEQPGNVEQ